MSSRLQAALEQAGLPVSVEARDGVAIIIPLQRGAIASDAQRRTALALAAEHGFSHVALELTD